MAEEDQVREFMSDDPDACEHGKQRRNCVVCLRRWVDTLMGAQALYARALTDTEQRLQAAEAASSRDPGCTQDR